MSLLGRRPVMGYVKAGASGKVKIRQGDDMAARVRLALRRDRATRGLAEHIKRERGWL